MGKHKKRHKSYKAKDKPQTTEEIIYEVAGWLAEDIDISYSEALGYALGVEHPYYG